MKDLLRHDLRPAVQPGPKVHQDLPQRLRRASVETVLSFVHEAVSVLAPAGLQSTDGGRIRKTSPTSERRQLEAGIMDRLVGVPGQEFFVALTIRSAPYRPTSTARGFAVRRILGRTWHPTLNCRSVELEQGNKNAQNENKSPRVCARP